MSSPTCSKSCPTRRPTFRQPFLCSWRTLALCVTLASVLTPLQAQDRDYSQVQIKTQQLTKNTYMLTGAGGNIGVSVGDDAVFIIDDQFAPLAPKIKAAIGRISKKPVQFVLNSHFHYDHVGGNEALAQAGALIVAHDNARRRMTGEQLISLVGARQAASPKAALPVVTVAGELTFHINDDEVHAFHVPKAHTDGDLIVHFRKADVVHMGDTYFNGFYPFIDSDSGGSADGVVAAADRVLALAGERTQIIPGHGPLSNKAELQTYRDMLAGVAQRIRELRKDGKTDLEVRAAKPSAAFDAKWGGGFFKPDPFVDMMLAALPR